MIYVHHIGSTSVKKLPAKPVIDILPVVRDVNRVDRYDTVMAGSGYISLGENGLPGRRYFEKGGDSRTHHLHIYQTGNPEILRHLAFRDYLQTHLEVAEEYGRLKRELARRFPNDIQAYRRGKERFVLEVEKQAVDWYQTISLKK